MILKILTASDVRQALPMAAAIDAVEAAFIQFSSGGASLPLRSQITPQGEAGTSLFMPAYLPELSALGAKIISIFPANIPKKLPTIHALVLMLDPATGVPLGLLDGASLTAIRTGAASGVATKYLSRSDSSVAAIFGAGVQARTQLEAICAVRAITTVWIFDPNSQRAEAMAGEYAAKGRPIPHDVRVAADPSEAVRQADIISTATTSTAPVFRDTDLKAGVHINAIGSYLPNVQEIPAETVLRARVIVDSLEATLAETGDFLIPMKSGLFHRDMIRGEIGQVASGLLPGRVSPEELTLFKSVGLAVQDIAAADRALKEAQRLGLGAEIEL